MEQSRDPLASPQPEALKYLPAALANRYTALPISIQAGVLTVAVPDPTDLSVVDTVAFIISGVRDLKFVKAEKDAIRSKIAEVYSPGAAPKATPGLGTLVAPSIDIGQKAERY